MSLSESLIVSFIKIFIVSPNVSKKKQRIIVHKKCESHYKSKYVFRIWFSEYESLIVNLPKIFLMKEKTWFDDQNAI